MSQKKERLCLVAGILIPNMAENLTGRGKNSLKCEVATGLALWTCYTSRFTKSPKQSLSKRVFPPMAVGERRFGLWRPNRAQCLALAKGYPAVTQVLCCCMNLDLAGWINMYDMRIDTCFWHVKMDPCFWELTCLVHEGNLTSLKLKFWHAPKFHE